MTSQKKKKPLWQRHGKIDSEGRPNDCEILETAWQSVKQDPEPALTHFLHGYPARLQPMLVRTLLDRFRPSGVYDPFCGSGTTLVESSYRGINAAGSDLSRLGIRLTKLKTRRFSQKALSEIEAQAHQVAEKNFENIADRKNVRAKLPRSEIEWYAPHNLRELAALFSEIQKQPQKQVLELIFSSIVTKVSLQASSTSMRKTKNRLRKGLPTEFFERKIYEWIPALKEYAERATVDPKTFLGDANESKPWDTAKRHVGKDAWIITSPPYGGIYNYADHHARCEAWLGIESAQLQKKEIGAKRNLAYQTKRNPKKNHKENEKAFEDAFVRWDNELLGFLKKCQKFGGKGKVAIILGDGTLGGQFSEADEQIKRLAPKAKLRLVARSSQTRPRARKGKKSHSKDRKEHIFLLERNNDNTIDP